MIRFIRFWVDTTDYLIYVSFSVKFKMTEVVSAHSHETAKPAQQPKESANMAQTSTRTAIQVPKDSPRTHLVVCFLPPGAARDVWTYLYVTAQDLRNLGIRVPIPKEDVPNGVGCSMEVFKSWIDLYASAGVIDCVGTSANNKDAFSFKIHPDQILVVEIEDRPAIEVPTVWCTMAQRARREIASKFRSTRTLRNTLAKWVEENFQGVRGFTATSKLLGYNPASGRTDQYWGIFYKENPNSSVYLPCLQGFEPYEFIPVNKAMRNVTRGNKAPPPTQAPVVQTPIVHSDNLLERVKKQRERLTQAEEILVKLEQLQEEQKRLNARLEEVNPQIAACNQDLAKLNLTEFDLNF